MSDELVHYSVASGIATITLDSPHNRNALSAQLRRELRACLAKARHDDAVRAIVLTHTGKVFCSGMDLKEARGTTAGQQGVNEFPEILDQLWNSPKPAIAKLRGPARAGGIGMVAACDIAVAVPEATFAFSEVRIGVVPAVISLVVLPRVTPRAAQELFLTGEVFDAGRAAEIGLITAVAPAEKLDDEVARYARSIALGGPNALAATKELLAGPRHATPSAGFQAMNELSAHFFAGEEGQEGITAFGEKRKPRWVPAD
ncbi:MAG TPA: enoyl-CoA hydratase-related protein [Amycolatopsis sp.]|nr:enoyl-CoA hydratase-related protein [Amycolatopsis sp.]